MKLHWSHPSTSLWAGLLCLALAAGWLIPNHYWPWLAFHANAWVAGALLLIALRGLYIHPGPVGLTRSGLVLVCVAAIPWLQHAAGLLLLRSDAALISVCLAGAAFAYIVAAHWSKADPLRPAAYVLAAMAIAAVISTALASYQWLGLAQDMGLMDIWVLPFAEGTRPYANMGQPNQLASLLLCGLMGLAWCWHARVVGGALSLVLAGWVVWGIALTESRTALLTMVVGVVFLTVKAPAYLKKNEVRAAQALFLFYLLCFFGKTQLAHLIGLDMPLTVLERSSGEIRTSLWKMSLDASLHSPWFGYGWNNSTTGYFKVFENYREKFGNTYFEQSHNVVLDLVLWLGWPLAMLFTLMGAFWLYRAMRSIDSARKLFVFSAMLVLLVHAMLEFPLHYGYFLWPFCVLAGSLAAGFDKQISGCRGLPRSAAMGLVGAFMLLEALIVTDYLKIEEAFTELRFQIARIGTGHDEALPQTLFLTDWPDVIALSRKTPTSGMSDEEIKHWEALMIYNTSPLAIRKVIGAYKLNGNEAEARAWALRVCWLLSDKNCAGLYDEWPISP